MRVDISGVLSDNPTIQNKTASFRLLGGGPYIYVYGQFGEHLVGSLSKGDAIIASGGISYKQTGDGSWEKYLNLTGNVTILRNKKVSEEEKAKLTFVTCGVLTRITPQQTKNGNMAKFTVEEVTVDFRGSNSTKHSMVAFEGVADEVLAMREGQTVMVAGNITRVRGRNDKWYTSFTATKVLPVEADVVVVEKEVPASTAPSVTSTATDGGVDEDDLPF
ncbi:MAG TPA: hypothetical protein ENG48_11110 [Candidatus Atribacteria bacterium]|nr:hypothetical protein [Candidatus Atribacteria bacterium]